MNQLKRSYSVGELTAGDEDDNHHIRGDYNRNNVKALPPHHSDTTDYHSGTTTSHEAPAQNVIKAEPKPARTIGKNSSTAPPMHESFSFSPSTLSEEQSSSDELILDQPLAARVTRNRARARARLF